MKKQPTFAARLRVMRQSLGLNQSQLAREANVSRSAVSQLESGRRRDPPWSMVCRLADALRAKTEAFRI